MKDKKFTDIKSESGRRNALNSTNRLDDFTYKDNSIDAQTPQETEEEQMRAEEIQYRYLMRYHKAKDLLTESKNADSIQKRADWLENLGYLGVKVKDYPKLISFGMALKLGYSKNISLMFYTEKKRLNNIIDESSKYLFQKSSNN